MRNTTKTFVASVGMGVCAISYAIGANSATGSTLIGLSTDSSSATDTSAATDTSSASASSSNSSSASSSASSSSSSSSTAKASSSASASSTTKATTKKTTKKTTTSTTKASSSASASSSSSSSSSSGGATSVSKTGDVKYGLSNDPYRDYAQLTVTKTNGKVTSVSVDQGFATHGWDQYYSYFAQLAVQSNGADIGSYSGATFASAAFNAALKSAMSKF